ncbi:MAG: carboxylesterase family protein [Bacteroidales bacterium]|nr:carboxylesterase family protein [Bacteroidales bacterium]
MKIKSIATLAACSVLVGLSSCKQNGQSAADFLGYDPDEQQLFIGDDIAIAQTQYGKVKGYILHGVYTYLGIPYGAPTSGENRFMPPQPPQSWDGILPTVFYGDTAPQMTEGKYTNSYGTFADHWNYYDVSEDCLKLNVWTPNTDSAKRPVLVWLHGGGYTNGNGIEQDGYHGENLAKKGNIVFVSINHRLGPIGFSDFSAVDPKFKDSGNVGMLDIHAALQWVHDNIANFGGDPSNVTVMGQSGGGAKVCNMVEMSDNKGLVHKGVALSGNTNKALDQNFSSELGKFIVKEAGLKPSEMSKLQQMPWREYYALATRAAAKFVEAHPNTTARGAFGPVADGVHFAKDTYYQDKEAWSNNVPMMFCTTTAEWGMSRTSPELEAIDKEQALQMLQRGSLFSGPRSPEKCAELYEAYANVLPNKTKPIEIVNLANASRDMVVSVANAKKFQDAPVYMAWFDYEPNLFNGRMRAFHCADICYWFKNTDVMITHTGGGKEPRVLSDKMSTALLSFMKTGNPNNKLLPEWPEYTIEEGAVMILSNDCRVLNDPDREARKSL